MSGLPLLFMSSIIVAAALGTVAIWAPRRFVAKAFALGLFALFLPVGLAGWSDLLSRPKPVSLEWMQAQAEAATVLAGSIREGQGIYVWLQLEGLPEPRAYQLPWNREQAEQLEEALRDAEAGGTGVQMRLPFEPTLDPEKPKFYAMPQPALPPKPDPAPAQTFNAPEQSA
jgi:hypothetical protein